MKRCSHCGVMKPTSDFHRNRTKKDGLFGECKVCRSEESRVYYSGNSGKIRARVSEHGKQTYKVRNEQERLDHRIQERQRAQKYSQRTEEQINLDCQKLHPEGTKRCRKCQGSLSLAEFHRSRNKSDGLNVDCKTCRKKEVRWLEKEADFPSRGLFNCVYCSGPYEHIDHVFPIAMGGTDKKTNLVPSCALCNQRKHALSPWTWLGIVRPDENHKELLDSWGIAYEQESSATSGGVVP